MHLVLVPLLCCFSLLGMDADTARLPKKCFGAALSDNCVTSCEGFIFNKDPHHPVACLSTLMLLYEGEKSVKDITNLKATQGFLQTRIKKALAANTEKPANASAIALKAFAHHFMLPYSCQGQIQLITPKGVYITRFTKREGTRSVQLDSLESINTQNNFVDVAKADEHIKKAKQ